MIEPSTHPSPKERIIYFHPIKSPAAAISLISPPPIPLPLVIKNNKYKKPLTDTKPMIYVYQCSKSVSNLIMPKIPMKILKATGISNVLQSMTLSANNAEVHKQYKILVRFTPFTITIIAYPRPLANSTNGYCAEIFVLQCLHFPPNIR